MKLNWKLLLVDLWSLTLISWIIFRWPVSNNFSKFGGIVFLIYLLINRIDAHYQFYKKQRRFY
jgi:hypothetical protein